MRFNRLRARLSPAGAVREPEVAIEIGGEAHGRQSRRRGVMASSQMTFIYIGRLVLSPLPVPGEGQGEGFLHALLRIKNPLSNLSAFTPGDALSLATGERTRALPLTTILFLHRLATNFQTGRHAGLPYTSNVILTGQ